MYNRIKTNSGFTLAEALVAILIMLMVSAIVATGIPSASNAYRNVVHVSNAEVLLSSTMSSLRNELGLARDVEINTENKSITYYNESYGSVSKIYISTEAKTGKEMIMYQRFAEMDLDGDGAADAAGGDVVRFISKKASGDDLYITFGSVTKTSDSVLTFNDLKVFREDSDNPLVTRTSLSIRVISGQIR